MRKYIEFGGQEMLRENAVRVLARSNWGFERLRLLLVITVPWFLGMTLCSELG